MRRLATSCALLALLLLANPAAAQDIVYELQAQYIDRFTQFIEWPASSNVSDTSAPFIIGVLGDTEVLGPLERLASARNVKGKKLLVQSLSELSSVGSCQMIYIAASESSQLDEILGQASGKPILTVGEGKSYAKKGVMFGFTSEGQTLRFEINKQAADGAGLKLAAKLVALAIKVY